MFLSRSEPLVISTIFNSLSYFSAITLLSFSFSSETLSSVIKVEDGVITALSEGSATLTVRSGNITESCYITVVTGDENTPDVILQCMELFYSNDYPIIGIENQNGGGHVILAKIFHQLLQIENKN